MLTIFSAKECRAHTTGGVRDRIRKSLVKSRRPQRSFTTARMSRNCHILRIKELVYIQSSSEDSWADPAAERLSARLASDVYEKIYGISGAVLPPEDEIRLDTPYHEGHIAHHTETGEHKITADDWDMFIAFWEKHRK